MATRKRGMFRRIAAICLACAGCAESERSTVFESLASPSGDFVLTATVIAPWFPQGPHQVALDLTAARTGERQPLLKSELAYDGVPFTRRNIAMRWTSERAAFVCLSATDRPDKGIQITVPPAGAARVEVRTGC
ncbi:MAG: hypothetical protein AB7O21_09340 [Gammaproteobacteria bacterium]